MENQQTPQKQPKKPLEDYARYSGMAIQMALIIGGGVWLGIKLDAWLHTTQPWFTLSLSLIAVIGAMYNVIKDFIKPK